MASPLKASDIEWVTLISQDGYTFVMDKRHALRSIFIQSMLGEGGGGAGQRVKRSNVGKTGAAAAMPGVANAAGKSSANAESSAAAASSSSSLASAEDNSASKTPAEPISELQDCATPPSMNGDESDLLPASANANDATGDPEGYVNPFASGGGDNDEGRDSPKRNFDFASGFAEARSNIVHLPNIRGVVLEKVVEFLCWNAKYHAAKDVDIPSFEHRIPPELALELLMAADYMLEA